MNSRRRMYLVSARDSDRPHISRPFRIEMGGHAWDAATDGHCLLLMKEPCSYEPLLGSPAVGKVLPKGAPAKTYLYDREELIDWGFCGALCSVCGGYGSARAMVMEAEGPVEAQVKCGRCQGTGFSRSKHGRFLHSEPVFDRRILWKVLQPTPPGTIEVATYGPRDAIRLIGNAWMALVMPISWDEALSEPVTFEGVPATWNPETCIDWEPSDPRLRIIPKR